tara:strand:+ start:259 stop:591 length:333 start_codon:yes stop_codon:yes gene_type:complete
MSKESGVNRGANGQFVPGHKIGKDTRFKENNNANPNGRNGALADIIKDVFEEVEPDGKTKKEKMIRKAYTMALNGNMTAMHYLSDRGEGKVKETREVTNKNEPIKIITVD